jgi:8-oxo-dGTP pyrophosphatase MutT (NUDIX family)
MLNRAYLERLSDAYSIMKQRALPVIFDEVAAAVCFRERQGKLEFLLVPTKDGTRWTFPKGHLKSAERPCDAAAREAREETGVASRPCPKRLDYYIYPRPPGDDQGPEYRVAAFLMEVESEQKEDEQAREREGEWFSLESALLRVASGEREKKYVREHRRILVKARKRLASRSWTSR